MASAARAAGLARGAKSLLARSLAEQWLRRHRSAVESLYHHELGPLVDRVSGFETVLFAAASSHRHTTPGPIRTSTDSREAASQAEEL